MKEPPNGAGADGGADSDRARSAPARFRDPRKDLPEDAGLPRRDSAIVSFAVDATGGARAADFTGRRGSQPFMG